MSNLKEYVVVQTPDEIDFWETERWNQFVASRGGAPHGYRIITTFNASDELKDSPYQGSAGTWRSDRVPDLADGKKAIPHYVKVKKQTHDGKEYVSKRVAYYFPDRFKSVEFEDWDDYDQEDFPYTTEDEEKGVVWLNAGWYESVNCDRCDEYWSAPLEVLEWLDSAATPAGHGWQDKYLSEMTDIMRDADKLFEQGGGGTRHYMRGLFEIMEEKGFAIVRLPTPPNKSV